MVVEWRMRPEAADDHWLEAIVGCAVATSIQGVILPGTDAKGVPRKGPMRPSATRRGRRR